MVIQNVLHKKDSSNAQSHIDAKILTHNPEILASILIFKENW